MTPNSIRLEISMESYPQVVVDVGPVHAVPEVGDFVHWKDPAIVGYVKSRRWKYEPGGTAIVRIWLHQDPPR